MRQRPGAGVRTRRRSFAEPGGAAAASLALVVLGTLLPGSLLPEPVAAAALVSGSEGLTPVLPHTIQRGKPAGAAILRGVDWSRARRAELPVPEALSVLWQRRIAGGLSGDVLVDDSGRVFATGQGRVLQLGSDGREQYLRRAEFTSAVASTLLADGQRVVLAREGTLAAWSADGNPTFQVQLQIPAGWTRGELLPLPGGSVLVSAGAWLLLLSAQGTLAGYTQLKEQVAETLVSAGQAWILTEQGDVLTWDGRSPPVKHGSFEGRVSTAAARASGQLLAVLDGRELVEWSRATAQRRRLALVEGAGASARLSVPSSTLVHILGAKGAFFSVTLDATGSLETAPESRQLPAGSGELLSGAEGAVAWFVSNAPLTVQRADGSPHSFDGVACAQPLSLLPAGSGRLLAACRSGQLWLLGPPATGALGAAARPDLGTAQEAPGAPALPAVPNP